MVRAGAPGTAFPNGKRLGRGIGLVGNITVRLSEGQIVLRGRTEF